MATPALSRSASATADITSSEVRSTAPGAPAMRAAELRVALFLQAYGLRDASRAHELAAEIAAACESDAKGTAQAIARAQQRVEMFLGETFGGARPDPLWLREFIETHPGHFLGDPAAARAAALEFGDASVGELPRDGRFQPQSLGRARLPGWLSGLMPGLSLTLCCVALLSWQLSRDGLSLLELLWALGYGAVLVLPALGAVTALRGALTRSTPPSGRCPAERLPRSAVVMPVYQEDPERTFAAVAAMRESLSAVPGGDRFDIHVLSDSRDAAQAADEERALRRVRALPGVGRVGLYYRRRSDNRFQKAGNLAEFFERTAEHYTYAVVLDADSLMTGETIVELARRMEDAPRTGLIQAALQLHGGQTLLARGQQFVASVCGPMFMRGLARWSGKHGNYYGHNAIIRVQAFMETCQLPLLSGRPPLGGHILSHDFVEAALLCRGGYAVQTAWDLQDSWEQMPQGLPEYVARDRRWCQGNLQHLRVLGAEGLAPMSRLHMAIGAWSYLSSPALLGFLALGILLAAGPFAMSPIATPVRAALLGVTAVVLLAPRLLGAVEALRDRQLRRRHGGALRLVSSVACEALLSMALAPLLVVHHSRAVISIVAGGAVGWTAQRRGGGGSARRLIRLELPSTLLGVALSVGLPAVEPSLWLWLWLSPLWFPLSLSIPIAAALSSPRLGRAAARAGLFATPSEREPHALMTRVEELTHLTLGDEAARFRDLVLDPFLLRVHLSRLDETTSNAQPGRLAQLRERALALGPAGLSARERALLSSDAGSMLELHREAWQRWTDLGSS